MVVVSVVLKRVRAPFLCFDTANDIAYTLFFFCVYKSSSFLVADDINSLRVSIASNVLL